jgi:hypothetical protein
MRACLLVLRGAAPVGNEFAGERFAGFQMLSNEPLRAFQAAAQRRDPQLVVLEAQQEFVPGAYAEGVAERCRDYDSSISVDPGPSVQSHRHSQK